MAYVSPVSIALENCKKMVVNATLQDAASEFEHIKGRKL